MSVELSRPLRLRSGKTIKNRLALAALTNGQSADDGSLGDDERRWLVRRARGGFGMVATCAAAVVPSGKGFDGQLGVFADAPSAPVVGGVQTTTLGKMASQIADANCCGIVQLVHGGARAPSRLTGLKPVAPSAFVEADVREIDRPRALSVDEIDDVIAAFIDAAVRSQRAGFAGVELHAAHGYLLSQFLSRTMNTRDDAWGGSLDKRMAIVRRLVKDIRARCGQDFVVGVRLSPEDRGFAKGLDLDETVAIAQALSDDGVDFIHLSVWDYRTPAQKYPERHPISMVKTALPADVAVIAAGGVYSRDDAVAVNALGADIVAVGRAGIIDPDWVQHVIINGREPRRPPISAHELAGLDVGPAFVTYLRRFKGFVAD